jgi:flagellar biosynthetic protein FliR
MLKEIVSIPTQEILIVFMMLCRISGVFLLIPPFGDSNVRPVIKVVLGLSISLMMFGEFSEIIRPTIKSVADDSFALTLVLISELFLGISFALIVKTLVLAVQVAGLTIASQIGLSAASMFDQSQQVQNSSLGLMLAMLTTIAILESGMHIRIIGSIYDSYNVIPVGEFFSHHNDFTSLVIGSVSKMWSAGIQISMPFILINIAMMVGAGILAKLMPQLQIFFVMLPIQIFVGIMIFGIVLSGILMWFIEFLSSELSLIF